jgi:hypothetical protein
LETLRKIGKTIALSKDVVGHEVRIQFQSESCLEMTMLRIAKSMTREERARVLTDEFEEKLVELEGLAEDHCIFERLNDVRLVLSSEQTSSDEVTEEEEEEEEEEEGEEEEEEVEEKEKEQAEQTDEGTESCDEDYHYPNYVEEDPYREEGTEDEE